MKKNATAELEALKLPELQARFAEVVGEETRAPNRKYLIRRITEALQTAESETESTQGKPTVEELRKRYLEVVGRPTGSSHAGYLRWKIRQAEKGRIPIGPRPRRRSDVEFKVIPIRLEAELVRKLDEAREHLGLRSRMDLFRRSLHAYLTEAGQTEAAERVMGGGS